MFLRSQTLVFTAVIIFSMLNGWAFSQGLRNNNLWGVILASLAISGTFYFLYLYQRFRRELSNMEDEQGQDHTTA